MINREVNRSQIYLTFVLSFNVYYKENLPSDSVMFGEYLPAEFDREYIDEYKNDDISYYYQNEKLIVNIVENNDKVELPLIYYKGYVAKDNKSYDISKSSNGLVLVDIDDETIEFIVYYEGTLISKISKFISFIGIITYLIFMLKIKKKSYIMD